MLIGSFPAAAFEQDPVKGRAAGSLLQALVASAGVRPEIEVSGGDGLVEARVLGSAGGEVLVAINHDTQPRPVTLSMTGALPSGWQQLYGEQSSITGHVIWWNAPARAVLVLFRR